MQGLVTRHKIIRRSVVIDNIKNLLFWIIVILLLLSICVTVDYAANDTITATSNQTLDQDINSSVIVLNGSYYSEEKVGVAKLHKVVTEKPKLPIISMYAKPSCGCNHWYTWHYREFINYCPNCGHYGTLRRNPKGVPEREYTCHRCSSDFCGVCGKEKYSWSRVHLRRV